MNFHAAIDCVESQQYDFGEIVVCCQLPPAAGTADIYTAVLIRDNEIILLRPTTVRSDKDSTRGLVATVP
jgi:hypothetical protein